MNTVLIVMTVQISLICIISGVAIFTFKNQFSSTEDSVNQVLTEILALRQEQREGNLRIMKALKGDSYVGQIGELDIHRDSGVPLGTAVIASS